MKRGRKKGSRNTGVAIYHLAKNGKMGSKVLRMGLQHELLRLKKKADSLSVKIGMIEELINGEEI